MEKRPGFAESFPRTPELDALVVAFEAGDYARVRSGSALLASTTGDETVRAAARLLGSRVEADPLAKWLFAMTALLLVFLSAYWMTHDGPRPAPPQKPVVETIH